MSKVSRLQTIPRNAQRISQRRQVRERAEEATVGVGVIARELYTLANDHNGLAALLRERSRDLLGLTIEFEALAAVVKADAERPWWRRWFRPQPPYEVRYQAAARERQEWHEQRFAAIRIGAGLANHGAYCAALASAIEAGCRALHGISINPPQ